MSTTIPSSKVQDRPRRSRLTNTNTDVLCCDTNKDSTALGNKSKNGGSSSMMQLLRVNLYRMNLWTGLYMLNPYERATFHIVGWVVFASCSLYFYVFWQGFKDGLLNQDHSYSTTNTMSS